MYKLENLLGIKTTNYNRMNYNGTHECNAKTIMIGIHINAADDQRNNKYSDIKWIPKGNGVWYATQVYTGFTRSEGFQITIRNNTLQINYLDELQSGVALVAIYEIFLN